MLNARWESQKVGEAFKEGGRRKTVASWRKGTLELKLNLERWVGDRPRAAVGRVARKSNKSRPEREAGNSSHLSVEVGAGWGSQEKSRRDRQRAGPCMAWWSCMEAK